MLSKEKVEIKSSMGAHDKIERSMWEEEDYINHKRWFQNGMRKKVSYNYGSILHIPNIHPYDEYILDSSSIRNKNDIKTLLTSLFLTQFLSGITRLYKKKSYMYIHIYFYKKNSKTKCFPLALYFVPMVKHVGLLDMHNQWIGIKKSFFAFIF